MRFRHSPWPWLALALLVLGLAPLAAKEAKVLTVAVQKTQIRSSASYVGTVVANLVYGQKVTVLDQPLGSPRDWLLVIGPDGSRRGWVNTAALSARKVDLSSSGPAPRQQASSGDVALAGKGFTAGIEAAYAGTRALDFGPVDALESVIVLPEDLAAFLDEGGLSAPGGRK